MEFGFMIGAPAGNKTLSNKSSILRKNKPNHSAVIESCSVELRQPLDIKSKLPIGKRRFIFNNMETIRTNPIYQSRFSSTKLALFRGSHHIRKHLLYVTSLLMMLFFLAPIVVGNSDSPHLNLESTTIGSTLNDKDDDAPFTGDICEVCCLVVKSFETGMEKTSRGKYEGGDTSWEEKNLGSYADSEVRLIEIQEDLCNEIISLKNKTVCLSMAENAESHIEDWWFNQRNKNVNLHDFLCISRLKHCCFQGTYGPNCQKCPSECNGHGKCHGSGTRQGTGACVCDQGYNGRECEQCDSGYFNVAINNQESTCLKCHSACLGCHGPGAGNCTECAPGYRRDQLTGNCVDVNECELVFENNVEATRVCQGNTYCVNTNGHYRCVDCHESCHGCVGPEPTDCISCAPGYQMDRHHTCLSADDFDKMTKVLGNGWLSWSPLKMFNYIAHHLMSRIFALTSLNGIISWYTGENWRLTLFVSVCVSLSLSMLMDFHWNFRAGLDEVQVNSE